TSGASPPLERSAGRRGRAPPERRADFPRETLGEAFLHAEIDHVFGLDDFARNVTDAAQRVGETELDAALSAPYQAGVELGRFLQPIPAPCLHRRDELLVNLADKLTRVVAVRRRQRREWFEEGLAGAGGESAPFDAQPVHRADEPETVHDHAYRPDQARFVDVDLVGCDRDVVRAGGADLL